MTEGDAKQGSKEDRPQYHHDASEGETRSPSADEPDPHHRLNTPVSEIERAAERDRLGLAGPVADVQGMGRPQTHHGLAPGDPELDLREDRETRNDAQNTPRGVVDAEAAAVRDAEEATGVPLSPGEPETTA